MYNDNSLEKQPEIKTAWGMIPLAAYLVLYILLYVVYFVVRGNIGFILYAIVTAVAIVFLLVQLYQKKISLILCIPFAILTLKIVLIWIEFFIALIEVGIVEGIQAFLVMLLVAIVFFFSFSLLPFLLMLVMIFSTYSSCARKFLDMKKIIDIVFYVLLGINELTLLLALAGSVITIVFQYSNLHSYTFESLVSTIGDLVLELIVGPLYLLSLFLIKRWIDDSCKSK